MIFTFPDTLKATRELNIIITLFIFSKEKTTQPP
jgi:hypothetical protein